MTPFLLRNSLPPFLPFFFTFPSSNLDRIKFQRGRITVITLFTQKAILCLSYSHGVMKAKSFSWEIIFLPFNSRLLPFLSVLNLLLFLSVLHLPFLSFRSPFTFPFSPFSRSSTTNFKPREIVGKVEGINRYQVTSRKLLHSQISIFFSVPSFFEWIQ